MCGRLSMFVPPSDLEERFDARPVVPIRPRYNIAPGDDLVTITNERPGEIGRTTWGLLPHWADGPAGHPTPINARAETVAEKPTFRDAFRERRCLVLADGYYEWRGERGSAQPYRITRVDEEPFAMAGLWERWGRGADRRETAAVVTTRANGAVASIHDRMPVVLRAEDEDAWLDADDPTVLRGLPDPVSPDALRAYPVSTAVNDPANDDPTVTEPADVGKQSGLSEFS